MGYDPEKIKLSDRLKSEVLSHGALFTLLGEPGRIKSVFSKEFNETTHCYRIRESRFENR